MFGGSHAHVLVEEGMGLSANHRALHQVSLQCRVLVLGHLQEKGRRLGDEEASSCCLNHQQQFALEAPWCFFLHRWNGPPSSGASPCLFMSSIIVTLLYY